MRNSGCRVAAAASPGAGRAWPLPAPRAGRTKTRESRPPAAAEGTGAQRQQRGQAAPGERRGWGLASVLGGPAALPSIQACQLPVTLPSATHFCFSRGDRVPVLCIQRGLHWDKGCRSSLQSTNAPLSHPLQTSGARDRAPALGADAARGRGVLTTLSPQTLLQFSCFRSAEGLARSLAAVPKRISLEQRAERPAVQEDSELEAKVPAKAPGVSCVC